jgi:hypothetical protein
LIRVVNWRLGTKPAMHGERVQASAVFAAASRVEV